MAFNCGSLHADQAPVLLSALSTHSDTSSLVRRPASRCRMCKHPSHPPTIPAQEMDGTPPAHARDITQMTPIFWQCMPTILQHLGWLNKLSCTEAHSTKGMWPLVWEHSVRQADRVQIHTPVSLQRFCARSLIPQILEQGTFIMAQSSVRQQYHVHRLEKAMFWWWIRSWMAKRPPKAAVRVTPVPMTSASRNTMMDACA